MNTRYTEELELELNEHTIPVIEQISEGMPGGFFIYHADDNEELIFFNKAMLRIFGCDSKEEFRQFTGNTFRGIVHPEDYGQVEKSIEKQVRNSFYHLDYVEYRIIRKDGMIRWVEDYGHFVHTRKYGDIYCVFIEDATERLKQRMDELEVINQKLISAYAREIQYRKAILFDAVSFYEVNLSKDVFLTDVSQVEGGRIESVFDILGIEPFKHFSDFIAYRSVNVDQDKIEAYRNFFDINRLVRCYSRGELEQTCDIWVIDIFGRKRLAHYIFLLGENEYSGDIVALSIAKDITEQVERQSLLQNALQQAKAASAAREAFLSNMSHDIRTPLNAIIGYTELVRQNKEKQDKVEEYIEKIRLSSEQLLSIVTDSLELTRMESGRANLMETDCHLDDLLSEVEENVCLQMNMKSIHFRIDKTKICNYAIVADFMRLKEILCQLLDNAAKYSNPYGNVCLTVVEKDIHLKDYRQYRFIIEDDGIGISEHFLDKLFEPFMRADNTTHSGVLGTGLGLAVVKSLVEMMEGEITVESEAGKGSKFIVTILFKLQREQQESRIAKREDLVRQYLPQEIRILLVEDNEINREIAVELLSAKGYIIETAEDGSIGVNMLKNAAPGYYSLILMDIQMPVMDGYEATRTIRKLEDPKLSGIPIIALSANAFAEDFQKSLEVGMNAHVAKPIDIKNLCILLDQILLPTL